MNAEPSPTIHEVDFCGQVASAANVLFAQDPAAFPFGDARVEGFGTGLPGGSGRTCEFSSPPRLTDGWRLMRRTRYNSDGQKSKGSDAHRAKPRRLVSSHRR